MTLHNEYGKQTLEQILAALAAEPDARGAIAKYLESLISARSLEMVSGQLAATASSVGRSANLLKQTIEDTMVIAKASIENSSDSLIAALKVNTETGTRNAHDIEEQIAGLTSSLANASAQLQNAGTQSALAARKLNRFTLVLAVATVMLAITGGLQVWETNRLVDLTAKQLLVLQSPPTIPPTPQQK